MKVKPFLIAGSLGLSCMVVLCVLGAPSTPKDSSLSNKSSPISVRLETRSGKTMSLSSIENANHIVGKLSELNEIAIENIADTPVQSVTVTCPGMANAVRRSSAYAFSKKALLQKDYSLKLSLKKILVLRSCKLARIAIKYLGTNKKRNRRIVLLADTTQEFSLKTSPASTRKPSALQIKTSNGSGPSLTASQMVESSLRIKKTKKSIGDKLYGVLGSYVSTQGAIVRSFASWSKQASPSLYCPPSVEKTSGCVLLSGVAFEDAPLGNYTLLIQTFEIVGDLELCIPQLTGSKSAEITVADECRLQLTKQRYAFPLIENDQPTAKALKVSAAVLSSSVSGNIFISDLPFLGEENGVGPVVRDGVGGSETLQSNKALTLDGTSYEKGLGTRAYSSVKIDIPPSCSLFQATLGIDDSIPRGLGNAVFEVRVDGQLKGISGIQSSGSSPLVWTIGLWQSKVLELIVKNYSGTHEWNYANWADAKLICATDPAVPYDPPGNIPTAAATDPQRTPTNTPAPTRTIVNVLPTLIPTKPTVAPTNVPYVTSTVSPTDGYNHFVSDLPMLSPTNKWGPIERDSSCGDLAENDGQALNIGGQIFAKGLGAHAPSSVSFDIPSGCTAFEAVVGIDSEVPVDTGSVVFTVNVNSTEKFRSQLKRSGETGTRISIPLTGAGTLELKAEDGGDGYYYDHADWADAKFICSGQPAATPTLQVPISTPTRTLAPTNTIVPPKTPTVLLQVLLPRSRVLHKQRFHQRLGQRFRRPRK